MRAAKILLLWLVGGLIIGCMIWFLPSKGFPQYTAQTFIRVLPATQRGPLLESERQPLNLPRIYCASVVALIKHQSTLEALVDRDEVQKTGWFQRLGKTKDERIAGAVGDLKKRFHARARPDSDLVTVSMTCSDGKEGAIVLNEMVDLFLRIQQTAKRKQIIADLAILEEQRVRLQRDLDLSEQEMDNVRRRYGFADLEQNNYPDPVTARLINLQNQTDNCTLEKREVQALLEDLKAQTQPSSAEKTEVKPSADIKDLQAKLKFLQSRFAELQVMREEAAQRHNELNTARTQYAVRQAIRDNRRRALESIQSRIEELKILHDDPDTCGVQLVEYAAIPRQADMWPWQTVIPTAAIAAVIVGIVHLLLTKQAK